MIDQLAAASACMPRILPKIEIAPSGCWLWNGAGSGTAGYGKIGFHVDGRRHSLFVHRLMFVDATKQPIPSDRCIDHLCFQRRCVNPEHLELVTYSENARRLSAPRRRKQPTVACKHGHQFSKYNTYIRKSGGRVCRECRKNNLTALRRRRGVPEMKTRERA